MEKGDREEPAPGGGVRERSGRRLSNAKKRGQRGGHRRSLFPRRHFPKKRRRLDAHSELNPGRRLRGPYSLRTLPRIVRPAQGAGRERSGRRSSAAGRSRRSGSLGCLPTLKTPAAHAGEAREPGEAPPAEPGRPTGPGQWRGAAAPPPAPAPAPPRPAHPASSPSSCRGCL